MNNYNISKEYIFTTKTISKGVQPKYKKGDYYYKVNTLYNEGLSEYLVTLLLQSSTLNKRQYVEYEYCYINNKLGCSSKDFITNSNTEFFSIATIYKLITGSSNLADKLMSFSTAIERLNFLCDLVESVNVPKPVFKGYLKILLELDMLTLNTDRHVYNFGLLYDNEANTFSVPPIFDNGASLHLASDEGATSCTLSGSFEDQVLSFGYPIKTSFKIDYTKLYEKLSNLEPQFGSSKELKVLYEQLEKYEYLFNLAPTKDTIEIRTQLNNKQTDLFS